MQSLLAQIVAGKWVSSAAMSIPRQKAMTAAHATITISNNNILESMIPTVRHMGVDPICSDTTTIGNEDTLPIYHADEYGLLEGNPCTSDTKDEPMISLHFLFNDSKLLLCKKMRNENLFCQCCVGGGN